MKRGDYVASRTKKTLLAKKWNGEKEVVWKLTPTQLEVAKSCFRVEPWLYAIKTRPFNDIRNLNSTLLKDIHFAYKKRKRIIVRKLKRSELKLLLGVGIKPIEFKYKIYLN